MRGVVPRQSERPAVGAHGAYWSRFGCQASMCSSSSMALVSPALNLTARQPGYKDGDVFLAYHCDLHQDGWVGGGFRGVGLCILPHHLWCHGAWVLPEQYMRGFSTCMAPHSWSHPVFNEPLDRLLPFLVLVLHRRLCPSFFPLSPRRGCGSVHVRRQLLIKSLWHAFSFCKL